MQRQPQKLGPKQSFRGPLRRGVAATEAAISLPILIFIVLGTLDCCNCIFLRQSLTVAAYEGARVAILPDVTAENVEAQTLLILKERGIEEATVTISPNNFISLPMGALVEVNVWAPAVGNVPVYLGMFISSNFESSVTMMIEN